MFVSGNPTLPGKIPPTLKFLFDFENGEKSVKMVYLDTFFKNKEINKKKHTDRPYLFFFQTVTRNRHIFLLGLTLA